MLKYEDIIKRMTEKQKVRLLTNLKWLGNVEYRALGIAPVRFAPIPEDGKEQFPNRMQLAACWDEELWEKVARSTLLQMREQDIHCAAIPGPKMKFDPYGNAVSEDPLLCEAFSGAWVKAAGGVGMQVCLEGFQVEAHEIPWLDRQPDERMLQQYLLAPYDALSREAGCAGVVADDADSGYDSGLLRSRLAGKTAIVHRNVSPAETVKTILRGEICVNASAAALQTALNRYRTISHMVQQELDPAVLEEETAAGKIISPQQVDEAVDRVIDFAQKSAGSHVPMPYQSQSDEQADAFRESVVLLENKKKILPLRAGKKILLVGDILSGSEAAAQQQLEKAGLLCNGFARGYELGCDRSPELTQEACTMAESADVVLVCLGRMPQQKGASRTPPLRLPANQEALLYALLQTKRPVVAAVSGATDLTCARGCKALLAAPLEHSMGVQALLEVVTGQFNPCGKLPSTWYFHADARLQKRFSYRDSVRTGPFMGYRYYDTAGFSLGYPFGFGRSYSRFAYSNLSVREQEIRFTLTNTSGPAGAEVVQIYLGKEDSALVRPKKELAGFIRVQLQPGESRQVCVPLKYTQVFDPSTGKWVVEKGTYQVYVASSVSDVRLAGTVNLTGEEIEPQAYQLGDYLQSETNIITNGYALEGDCRLMKKSWKNVFAGGLMLAAAVCLKTCCVLAHLNVPALDWLALVLCAGAVVYFILHSVEAQRIDKANAELLELARGERFADAQQVESLDMEDAFVREFDRQEPEDGKQQEGTDQEQWMHIDTGLTFRNACQEFETFARERGIDMSQETVRRLFAAMSSSRLVLVPQMQQEDFANVVMTLCAYFGTNFYHDMLDDTYTEEGRLLFAPAANGRRERTNLMHALQDAASTHQNIHLAALSGVTVQQLGGCALALATHARRGLGDVKIHAMADGGQNIQQAIPANLWVFAQIRSGEKLQNLLPAVADVAAVCPLEIRREPVSQNKTEVADFHFYQMEYLTRNAREDMPVGEDSWKRIDRLVEFAARYSDYHMSDYLWAGLEQYLAAGLACGCSLPEAMDDALAARVLPSLMQALEGKIPREDKGLSETLDELFADNTLTQCRRILSAAGGSQL